MFSVIFLLLLISFIIGVALLYRGLRGRPVFTAPQCAKCRYDLRSIEPNNRAQCPECGADLSQPDAVRFGDYAKNPRLIKVGGAMIALPLLLLGASILQAALGYQWEDLYPTDRIIARLSTTANEPWDWQRLERRYRQGRMTREQIADTVDQLIVYLQNRAGGSGHLPWADDFVGNIMRNNLIDPPQMMRLIDAFYGEPTITAHQQVRSGSKIDFRMDYAQHWHLPGMKVIFALTDLSTAKGEKLQPMGEGQNDHTKPDLDLLSQGDGWSLNGDVMAELSPGEHELLFTLECAAVGENEPTNIIEGRPGQPHRWRNVNFKWTKTLRHRITVTPADVSPITTTNDPALDPMKLNLLSVSAIVVKPYRNQVRGHVMLAVPQESLVPLSFDVFVRISGKERPAGKFYRGNNRSMNYGNGYIFTLPSLPANITEADVILRPNVKYAEDDIKGTRIWGGEIVFEKVQLQREDLATQKDDGNAQ